MIEAGINLEKLGEAFRFSVRGFLRVRIKITAGDATTGAIEVQRAYGQDGPLVAYSPAQSIQINGSETITLIVDDCPELALVVTTAGSGSFDVEWMLDLPTFDTLEDIDIDLDAISPIWSSGELSQAEQRCTFVVRLSDTNAGAAIEARELIDLDGYGATIGGPLALDETTNPIDLDAIEGVDLYCTSEQANLGATIWIYKASKPESFGILPSNVALLDAMNIFSTTNTFELTTNLEGTANIKGQKKARFYDADSSEYIGFKAPTIIGVGEGGFDYTVPIKPTISGQLLSATTAGVMSWTNAPAETSGSSFPASPTDGQEFYRTDLDMPEMFRWDAGRSKWLGELRVWQLGRNSSGTSWLDLMFPGAVQFSSSRGILTPSRLTIVGIEFYSSINFTGELALVEGSSSSIVATLLSVSGSKNGSDHTLNQAVDADSGWPQKWFKFRNITSGTCSYPCVNVYVRRYES